MLMHYVKIDPTSSAMVSESNHCYAIDLICHMDTIPTGDWIYSRKMVSRSDLLTITPRIEKAFICTCYMRVDFMDP